jgi:DNA polymerase-3 subunit delta'
MDCFNEIIGQERALLPLKRALKTGKINHAYLFAGPSGVGKTTCAELFARSIIVKDDLSAEILVREKVHPDLMVLEKDNNKTMISIEKINREMEPWLSLKPYRADWRVVIIKEAHLLSLPAANALLKTLEEPPGHAVIILVSDEQNLLETIISRCQLIRFFPLNEADIKRILLSRGVEEERAGYLARLGQGSIAATIQWANEEGLQEVMAIARAIMTDIARGNEVEVLRCAEIMEKNPAIIASILSVMLRDIYLYQTTGREELLVVRDNLEWLQGFKRLKSDKVQASLAAMHELRQQYRSPVNTLLLNINFSYQLRDALENTWDKSMEKH